MPAPLAHHRPFPRRDRQGALLLAPPCAPPPPLVHHRPFPRRDRQGALLLARVGRRVADDNLLKSLSTGMAQW